MKIHFYNLFPLLVFMASLISCAFAVLCFYLFLQGGDFAIIKPNPSIFPTGFQWTSFFRMAFIGRILLLQFYVFCTSLFLLFLCRKRYIPGAFYLLLFVAGWLFEAPKALVPLYGNALFLSDMSFVSNLSYFGHYMRMSALLFFTLHEAGMIKQYSNKWQMALFVVFFVIFRFLRLDVSYMNPTGLLHVSNMGLVSGFTIACFLFTVVIRFLMLINPKMQGGEAIDFLAAILIFVVSNILFLQWETWELFIGLGVLCVLTIRILYNLCRQYRWFVD